MNVIDILSHPLSLLLIGALLTGLLFPYFAKRGQNHQKELEIKIDLVGRVSESVMNVITATDYIQAAISKLRADWLERKNEMNAIEKKGPNGFTKPELYAAATKNEEVKRSFDELETKSFAELRQEYKKFEVSSAIIGTYLEAYFAKTDLGSKWTAFSRKVVLFYAMTEENFNKAKLADRKDTFRNWQQERDKVLKEKSDMIQLILKSHITAFSTQLF